MSGLSTGVVTLPVPRLLWVILYLSTSFTLASPCSISVTASRQFRSAFSRYSSRLADTAGYILLRQYKFGQHGFCFHGPAAWNSLPSDQYSWSFCRAMPHKYHFIWNTIDFENREMVGIGNFCSHGNNSWNLDNLVCRLRCWCLCSSSRILKSQSYGVCLEVKMEDYQNCPVSCVVYHRCAQWYSPMCEQFLQFYSSVLL